MVVATTKASQTPQTAKTPPSNEDGLKMLEQQKNSYTLLFSLASSGALGLALLSVVPGLLLLGFSYSSASAIAKCARLEKALEQLLIGEFRALGMQAFPLLMMKETVEHEHIDLYVRFPGKTQIFMALRSEEGRSIIYNESKEKFQARKPNGKGLVNLRPCPLDILNRGKNWLNRNRQAFGLSSRQVTKIPTVRVLVAWGNTQIATHRDELYATVGSNTYLSVQKDRATTFVIKQEELAIFVRDWLSHIHKK